MRRYRPAFRLVSIVAAAAMVIPIVAPAAQAAVVSIFSPQPGESVPGRNVEVAVGYNTQSDAKVTRIELWIDGRLHSGRNLLQPLSKGVASFWWDAGKTSSGSHEIAVKVYSGDKLIGSSRSHATIGRNIYDLRPPSVRLANIKPGQTLKGRMPVIIESVDDGDEAPIVSLLVDNGLKMLSNNRPLVYDLDTTRYTNGKHEIKVLAYDSSGNKSEPVVVGVVFENDVELPVAVAPGPAAPPDGVPASEDDYAPAIPSLDNAAARQDGIASRSPVDPNTGALAPTVARPLPIAKSPQPDIARRTNPVSTVARTESPKNVRTEALKRPPQALPVPDVKAKTPTGVPAKSQVVALNPSPAAGVAKETSRDVPIKPVVVAGGTDDAVSRQDSEPRPPTVAVLQDAPKLKPAQVEPALGAKAVPPSPPRFEPAVTPVTEGPMIPMPDVKPNESLPVSEPAAELKPNTLVAMAMTREKETPQPAMVGSIPTKRDTKAKLEKRVVPVSGKVKIRDIFDEIGGVLFWDSSTRTVIGYASGMKMELRIGSRLMKVNGRTAKISKAPYIVAGRTIIDAGIYHQARELANLDSKVATR